MSILWHHAPGSMCLFLSRLAVFNRTGVYCMAIQPEIASLVKKAKRQEGCSLSQHDTTPKTGSSVNLLTMTQTSENSVIGLLCQLSTYRPRIQLTKYIYICLWMKKQIVNRRSWFMLIINFAIISTSVKVVRFHTYFIFHLMISYKWNMSLTRGQDKIH